MNFKPVRTIAELETLNEDEMLEGHLSAERGDPEPGENRGRSFWHGWRTRMMDLGEIEIDADHRALVREVVRTGYLKVVADRARKNLNGAKP